MRRVSVVWSLFLVLALATLAGCTGGSDSDPIAPLSAANVNLVFVVSPDLAYHAYGDVDSTTANLTNQGLQRSLRLATYLKQQVLGGSNVTVIAALEPMTHLQTANNYPDMTAIGYIQQFALLNQTTLIGITANSYPIATSYGSGSVPSGVATPSTYLSICQGLDFSDAAGNNIALATRIINANVPGFYVFSAPWETISTLMATINRTKSYNLSVPTNFISPNYVYAISITPSGGVTFAAYNSNVSAPSTYPVLPSPVGSASCNVNQTYFNLTNQSLGGSAPANANKNETVYLMRHAEAHPGSPYWDDGNYVGPGQWRALALPSALQGKISPDVVYSIDPAQPYTVQNIGIFSYIRPSLTVLPYVIANNLPYNLVASFLLGNATDTGVAQATSNFFFAGGTFSNKTVLLAWEHDHFPPLVTALFGTYGVTLGNQTPSWPDTDYDTIWRVRLDGQGNVTVDNALCEGIDSSSLPAAPPQF